MVFVGLLLLGASVARASSESCTQLRGYTLAADGISLPTQGAVVSSTARHHEGGMAFCKVLGRVRSVDPAAEDIRFEVNLPETWNGKALQFGGGTFDGYLITGLGRTAVGAKSQATPLSRGYATFGSDSGHHKNYFPFPDVVNTLNAKFARNAEQQKNFAGDQLKKVHDVAVALMRARYGRAPERMYFIGGSTGGREALRVAQRYPADYDGVLAAYAAWDSIELDLQFMRTAQALYAKGGFLGHAQTKLIEHTVEKACDGNDGVRDGIISDPLACHVEVQSLRCKDGGHHHGCLSDAQMHTLEVYATPQRTEMPMAHGVDSIPGYDVLAGADLTGATGFLHFALKDPVFLANSFGYVIGDDVTRNFLTVSRHFDSRTFDVATGGGQWHDDVLRQSQQIDSSDVNLGPFFSHGGKLILVHGTADTVIPTNSTVDYYERVRGAMGADAVAKSVRMYIVPGLGHGFGKFNAGFDTIGTLDGWVSAGVAPENLVAVDNHGDRRTRPLCVWPTWPRYNGTGNVNTASSFSCLESAAAAEKPSISEAQ